jgi:hypothetical protein
MGFLKNLFSGVYASNGGIRLVFLPLCYALLISPFALLFIRLYKIKTLGYITDSYGAADIIPQLFIFLVTVSLATRSLSGVSKNDRKGRVQLHPYWLPGVRHWVNIVFGGEEWLKSVR